MSASSQRGKELEKATAKILRQKLRINVQRDSRSGAGDTNKMDIQDWYNETRLAIECKNHQTIKIREWMRQAIAGASYRQIPTVVFTSDDEILATLRFSDLVDLIAEIKQGEAQIEMYRQPDPVVEAAAAITHHRIERGAKACRNGHLVDSDGYCMDKHCVYRRGYKAPRAKK